jgi:D-alanine-D-alanine ligase-like ATP-grasp enzyme
MIIKNKDKIKKICILVSSYEGANSEFEKYDEYQDPSRYVTKYDFHLKCIKKETAIEQLNEIYKENFDIYISFLWGQEYDNVAGIDALKYMEKLNVLIIGTNSKFLSMSKLDFKKSVKKVGIFTPNYYLFKKEENEIKDLNLKYPLIIKPENGCGSLYMTDKSVCYNEKELKEQLKILMEKVDRDILIEEFIIGKEFSIMVIENKNDVIAMEPIVYNFPENTSPTQQFLHFENKFEAVDNGEIEYKIYDENKELINKIKEVGCNSYKSLNVTGSGYARIDMRIDDNNNVYVLEINHTPAFFCQIDNEFGDDYIIQKCFKNGHIGLVDHLIATKIDQIEEGIIIKNTYDNLSEKYNEFFNKSNFPFLLENISKIYDFNGNVLDLGCGTGMFGDIILKHNNNINLTGIDASPKMSEKAKKYKKIHIGLIQNIINNIERFEHIISSGTLHFLNNVYFEKVLFRIFEIASKSITLTIEDIPDIYNKNLIDKGIINMYSYNNTKIIDNFIIPNEWNIVYKEKVFMWDSPSTGDKIYGTIYRYEKNLISDLNIGNKE